jgi:hypothetical protein
MKDQPIVMEGAYAKQYTDWMVKTGGYARDMTLRDHYAGLAMQTLIPIWHADFRAGDLGDGTEDWDYFYVSFAAEAYLMADDMLKERIK